MNFRAHDMDKLDADDIIKQSVVLLTFTVCRYNNKRAGFEAFENALSFYVHDIALIADGHGSSNECTYELKDPLHAGLDLIGYPNLTDYVGDAAVEDDIIDSNIKDKEEWA
jgi:hypothetical protein